MCRTITKRLLQLLAFLFTLLLGSTAFRSFSIFNYAPTTVYVAGLPPAKCAKIGPSIPPRIFVSYPNNEAQLNQVDRDCIESWTCVGLEVTLLTDEFARDLIKTQ